MFSFEEFHFEDGYKLFFELRDISGNFKIDKSKLHVYVEHKEKTYPIVNGTK